MLVFLILITASFCFLISTMAVITCRTHCCKAKSLDTVVPFDSQDKSKKEQYNILDNADSERSAN